MHGFSFLFFVMQADIIDGGRFPLKDRIQIVTVLLRGLGLDDVRRLCGS